MTYQNSSITLHVENKPLQVVWRTVCYLPWAWLISLAVFALTVTVQVGHFPYYGNPDPKDTGLLTAFYYIVAIGIPLLFASIPVWGILGIIIKLTTTYRFRWQEVVLYLLGMLICGWVAFTDFASLITWVLD